MGHFWLRWRVYETRRQTTFVACRLCDDLCYDVLERRSYQTSLALPLLYYCSTIWFLFLSTADYAKHNLSVVASLRATSLRGFVARVRLLFEQACEVNEWRIEELGIQPDHLQLMIQVHPRESVASVVKTLKGGSSRVLRVEFPELEEFRWSSSFWASGYFAETVIVFFPLISCYALGHGF